MLGSRGLVPIIAGLSFQLRPLLTQGYLCFATCNLADAGSTGIGDVEYGCLKPFPKFPFCVKYEDWRPLLLWLPKNQAGRIWDKLNGNNLLMYSISATKNSSSNMLAISDLFLSYKAKIIYFIIFQFWLFRVENERNAYTLSFILEFANIHEEIVGSNFEFVESCDIYLVICFQMRSY